MSEYNLHCNFKNCGIAITSFAWVTSCSHAFCEEHIDQEPDLGKKCLACDTPLKSKYDIVRADLNPSEEFKSMVLAGLRPEIIMDIVSRGIGFWCHQMFQEKMIHKAKALQIETHLNQIESSYETLIVKMKNDLQVENKNYESLKKLSDDQARRILELEDCLNKKNQEIRSLQMRFNMMKRETLSTALSQGITSPGHHLLERRKRLSPKYMDQQSMINCPESFSQQDNNHQTHQHQQHFHYKHEEPSTIKGDSFQFKPNTFNNSTSEPCKHFHFPFSKD
ncbi:E3 ubiquitin-protein ligase CCNB1IP1-like isoform X2 [Lycorma delicatula]|uniref:E3 ubiquitin-protein ligase CCNB1IP1-like isoform X2 n=1 Tax=Lycorma delicatula TaxID=130591 RepID=UPI003F51A986